jgi:nicotinamide-nucleotide amidase
VTETLAPLLPDDVDDRVTRVLRAACDAKLTLVTAESCTGGLLASLLTDVDGCSHAFERGFVTYTNEAKRELLGVPSALLEDPGAVSEPVARAMAEGALRHSRGDIAVSITGFAGPAGPGDPPGLVHFAVAARRRPTLHRVERFGDVGRGEVRLKAIETALDMLREAVQSA